MYSENQSRQLYVVKSASSDNPTNSSTAGAAKLIIKDDEAYFLYKGPSDDGLQRSDLIKKCNVKSVSLSNYQDLQHKNKQAVIKFADGITSTANNTTTVTIGGDYILNVDVHGYVAMDYNTTLRKFGVAHVAAGTTESAALKAIAESLVKNFKREEVSLVKVGLSANANGSSPTWQGSAWSGTGYKSIVIEEVEQPFRLGVTGQNFVDFTASASTVYKAPTSGEVLGEDVYWGTVTYGTGDTQSNSKKIADMEYFYHKNRGDVYGYSEWPNNTDTQYLANSNDTDNWANGYSVVDIHFYYEGNSHNIGHSEKTITLVGKNVTLVNLIGQYYVPAQGQTAAVNASKLFEFLNGTNAQIYHSAHWSNATS